MAYSKVYGVNHGTNKKLSKSEIKRYYTESGDYGKSVYTRGGGSVLKDYRKGDMRSPDTRSFKGIRCTPEEIKEYALLIGIKRYNKSGQRI